MIDQSQEKYAGHVPIFHEHQIYFTDKVNESLKAL